MIHQIRDDLYLVSPVDLPPTLLPVHLTVGAQLILVRQDLELFNNDDVFIVMAEMIEMGAKKPGQRVLLLNSPFLTDAKFGETARYWVYRGGVVLYQHNGGDIKLFLAMVEKELKKIAEGQKTIWTDGDDEPMQQTEVIKDWRRTIVTFPGMGTRRIEKLPHESTVQVQLWQIMHLLSRQKDPIAGEAIGRKAREWLGLETGEELMIVANEESEKWAAK